MLKSTVHVLLLVVLTLAGFSRISAQSGQEPQGDSKPKPEAALSTAEQAFLDAVRDGKVEAVRALLQQNPALLSVRDAEKSTALHVGARNEAMVRFLLEKKADVNAQNEMKETPLYLAADAEYLEAHTVIEMLLAAKADPNIANNDGDTPLHVARSKDIAELILAKGGDVRAVNDDGWTPLHSAVVQSREDVVEILLANKADVNAKAKDGSAPLHLLVDRPTDDDDWMKNVAEMLLAHKADVNAKNNKGETPLSIAILQKQTVVIEVLRKHGAKE